MATSTQIPVEEYLRTIYHPDRDYVDGVLEERNLGETDHGWIQAGIVSFFRSRFHEIGIAALPETRFQVSPNRFRVPDVVVTQGRPEERIITKAPLLCVEILSPEDRISRVNERIREYLDFGVPVVWLIDPEERTIWIYRSTGMEQATANSIKLDGTSIEIAFSEIFD